ncbi:MAG: metallophosphoesterase, partial [Verrucomicrobiales bacterium]
LTGGDDDHSFTTLPNPDSTGPLRLWVVGDSGNGSQAQLDGYNAMRSFVANDGKPIDAYLHLGDMAYNTGLDSEFEGNFFRVYRELLRNTVVWPTMGNHEGANSFGIAQEGPYFDAYALPTVGESGGLASGTEAYYAFDIGRVHFICLDSHDLDRSATGDMALWLKADLEMADADWLIAFWHHPPYTKGTHDSDRELRLIEMREFIMPILESGGVDLVLAGHSHIYERSMLVDGAYATPTVAEGVVLDDGDGDPFGNGPYLKSAALNPNEGTVAVVAGHGRSATRYFGISPIMRSTIAEVGSVIIDIDDETLTGKMVNSAGLVRDEFQMVKQGVVTPTIVEDPWQPRGPEFRTERLTPGVDQLEIFPVPDAPDAVIYYTTDGTFPTLESPIYDGPIDLGPSTRVQAFSTWKGGERSSLVTQSTPLESHISIQKFVASSTDDGFENALGNVTLDQNSIDLGDGLVGLRFPDVNLPADAFIVRAQIQFQKRIGSFVSASGEIWGDLAVDSAPFSDVLQSLSLRHPTNTRVPWQVGSWTMTRARDFQSETADLGGIIGELRAIPGWGPGKAMGFFFSMTGARQVETYESGPARAAALRLTYIEAGNVVDQIMGRGLQLAPLNGLPQAVSFSWPIDAAVEAFGLTFAIEISQDLLNWTPLVPSEVSSGFASLDGFRQMLAIIAPEDLIGKGKVYFRLRVSQAP